MKKKLAIMAVCSFAVLILAGCGKNGPEKNDQKSGAGQSRQQGAPAEFSSACQGKNEGDGCEMSVPQKDNSEQSNKISGTCKKAPSGDQLSCMPQGGSGRPGGQASDANAKK